MSARLSGTEATEAEEGPVDLDDDVFFDELEIASQTNHHHHQEQQQQQHGLSHVRIVDLTPQMFYLNQRAANVEAQRLHRDKSQQQQQAQSHRRRKSSSRKISRRLATPCLPRWIFSAPTWVQFLGFGGFVLVVSSMVFLAVYHLIQWDSKHRDSTNVVDPPEYHTTTPQYPPQHDRQQQPTPSPSLVTTSTAPEQWQSLYRNNNESLSNATETKTEDSLDSPPTAFPTFAPAPPLQPNQG